MTGQRAPRRFGTFLVVFLAIALAFADILFSLLATGRWVVAIMAIVAGMLILVFFQYAIWGWPLERNQWPAQRDAMHFPR